MHRNQIDKIAHLLDNAHKSVNDALAELTGIDEHTNSPMVLLENLCYYNRVQEILSMLENVGE